MVEEEIHWWNLEESDIYNGMAKGVGKGDARPANYELYLLSPVFAQTAKKLDATAQRQLVFFFQRYGINELARIVPAPQGVGFSYQRGSVAVVRRQHSIVASTMPHFAQPVCLNMSQHSIDCYVPHRSTCAPQSEGGGRGSPSQRAEDGLEQVHRQSLPRHGRSGTAPWGTSGPAASDRVVRRQRPQHAVAVSQSPG